jgi:hypothetical protein
VWFSGVELEQEPLTIQSFQSAIRAPETCRSFMPQLTSDFGEHIQRWPDRGPILPFQMLLFPSVPDRHAGCISGQSVNFDLQGTSNFLCLVLHTLFRDELLEQLADSHRPHVV